MESACHCSVQAGKLLWLLVQGSMYSLQNGYMPSLAQAGPVHMAVMRAFCIGVKSYSQFYVAAFGLGTSQPWAACCS